MSDYFGSAYFINLGFGYKEFGFQTLTNCRIVTIPESDPVHTSGLYVGVVFCVRNIPYRFLSLM